MEDQGAGENVHQINTRVYSGAVLERSCDHCGAPLQGAGRGKPQRFCQAACRRAFEVKARRAGDQVLRRRRARAQAPRIPRPRLTARAKRVLAVLIAAGSVLTGIPIPSQAAGFPAPRRREGAPTGHRRAPGVQEISTAGETLSDRSSHLAER